jgi:preprotein translocase subunit SecE
VEVDKATGEMTRTTWPAKLELTTSNSQLTTLTQELLHLEAKDHVSTANTATAVNTAIVVTTVKRKRKKRKKFLAWAMKSTLRRGNKISLH